MKNKPLPRLDSFQAYEPGSTGWYSSSRERIDPDESLSSRLRIVSWICRLVAAGIMLETLFFKFTAAPESVYIFRRMGTEPWWRWGQGIWELVAAICLLLPGWSWAGGILATGAMLAAILSHMTWLGYTILGDHGLLFGMAVVTFVSGFTVMMIHRHSIPFVTPMSRW